MTTDDSFSGYMESLNLDETQFPAYPTDFDHHDISQLSQIKVEIESQLELLFDLLKHKYNADMDTSLVTRDGFPRADIDVVSIRLARVKILRLRNDHKKVLDAISEKLVQQMGAQTSTTPVAVARAKRTIPFATVKQVEPSSPAHTAGLKEGDLILDFDGVHVRNHDNLKAVAARVQEGKEITVELQRGPSRLEVQLRPQKWDGAGLLGCRLVPL